MADLFVYLYVWIDDTLKNRQVIVPDRPGPVPVCSDAEVLTVALARHCRAVTSENAWLAEVRAEWGHYRWFVRSRMVWGGVARLGWRVLGAEMTRRVPCPPAPGPLEGYAARFDDLFSALGQRRGFREYLTGLLAPRARNKRDCTTNGGSADQGRDTE